MFEAICFFGRKSIVKQMRYSEFEAVLDGVVGVTELANKEVQAAYVKITSGLKIHSVVTFNIEFNANGFADEDWNIPLRHLADNAGPGPDLGAGPIRLACRSQCSVSWYQRELWEPNQRDINHFQLLKEAVAGNKLGLIKDEDDFAQEPPVIHAAEAEVPLMSETVEVPTLDVPVVGNDDEVRQKLEAQAAEFQKKVDLLISRQKQTLQGLEEKYRDEIDQVKRAMRNEAQSYRHRAQELEQQSNQNRVLLEKLQSRNTKLEREQIQLREQAESQKDQYDQLKDEYLTLLRNQNKAEDEKTQEVIHLKEELTAKSVEMEELAEDIASLRVQNAELTEKVGGYQQQVHDANSSNTTEMAELNNTLEEKQNEIAQLRAQILGLQSEKERFQSQVTSLKTESDRNDKTSAEQEARNQSLLESLKTTEFKVQELTQSVRKLTAENERLAEELSEAEDNAVDSNDLFSKMEQLELVFVAYHPGAGHISLPARQLEDYLEKPLAVAAQKCAVTLEHYKAWLVHHDSPECEECGVPVKRVDTPSDFQPGISNHCVKHRVAGGNIAMFRKSS
ncbi:ATPase involved in DNA repair [Reinekea sp. MED297]|uniref:ATPase involved in DNA repair n=1 Tax=Reinekea blandensis MED297 TaxID=314283 RepID=A4BCK6_9GAMM|nr:ATPase involved in DNA repair [Reinekea sp. MED297] [Reinekea blandensis MED297]